MPMPNGSERLKQTARKPGFGRAPWNVPRYALTARKSVFGRSPIQSVYEDMGFSKHDVLKSRFESDGPQPISDPLTPEQEKYLRICVDSAFKAPNKTSSWADPYYPGMDNLKKWFQHHKEIKTARTKHRYLLTELAVYESVEDAQKNLQCVFLFHSSIVV